MESSAGGRLRRGCSFNRRFVLLAGAHFHAKSPTSEHLLLLNALSRGEGRESCGAGRAHSEERGPGSSFRAPGAPRSPGREPARTCWPEGVACRSASGLVTGRNALAAGVIAPGLPRFPAGELSGANFASCCPVAARPGWESLWTCQLRSPPPPRAEVRAPARGPRWVAGGCGAGARLGDAAGGDPAPGAGRDLQRGACAPGSGTRPWRMREPPARGQRQSPSRSPRRGLACPRRSPGSGPT